MISENENKIVQIDENKSDPRGWMNGCSMAEFLFYALLIAWIIHFQKL